MSIEGDEVNSCAPEERDVHGRASYHNSSVLLNLTSYRERRLLFLTLMQIGTRFLAFALQLDWKRGFVGNADLRFLHKLASTNPNGQLAT